MATLHSPYMQAVSSAGVPLSGAKLYFYQAGTTTDITTYQDSAAGTPHAQPVVADASGIFAPIWVSSATYKAVLKTSADVTVLTVDNIDGSSAAADEFSDATFRLQDNLDATKELAFQLSGITAATTRTITVPDADGTLVLSSSAASTTAAGLAELATTTETITGTDTTRTLTADGLAALWEAGTDNAGDGTITMGEGGYFNLITSTTAITAFVFTTDKAGRRAHIRFNTARTLTHNATSLILPGGANITTVAGDIMGMRSLGSGNFVVEWYMRASEPRTYVAGDILYASSTTALSRLAKGTALQVLTMNSGGTAPEWAAAPGQPIPTDGTLGVGCIAFLYYSSITLVNNLGTAAGSTLSLSAGVASSSTLYAGATSVQTGTWKNISGVSQDNDGTFKWGYWVRTA